MRQPVERGQVTVRTCQQRLECRDVCVVETNRGQVRVVKILREPAVIAIVDRQLPARSRPRVPDVVYLPRPWGRTDAIPGVVSAPLIAQVNVLSAQCLVVASLLGAHLFFRERRGE